ncbi:MAG TPA: hypothetical protein VF884_15340, partial [Nitrososphaeraceae archaeon]
HQVEIYHFKTRSIRLHPAVKLDSIEIELHRLNADNEMILSYLIYHLWTKNDINVNRLIKLDIICRL